MHIFCYGKYSGNISNMKIFHIKKYPDAAHTGSGIFPSAPSRDGLAASLIPMPIMKNKK